MSCFKCRESFTEADLSCSEHFILFCLHHRPNVGPHSASGRCSHGGGGEFPRGSTDLCDVIVKLRAETGLLPKAGYPIFTENKSSALVFISPRSDIDATPWTCRSAPADNHTHEHEGNQAPSFQLSHAYTKFGSAILCSLGTPH